MTTRIGSTLETLKVPNRFAHGPLRASGYQYRKPRAKNLKKKLRRWAKRSAAVRVQRRGR